MAITLFIKEPSGTLTNHSNRLDYQSGNGFSLVNGQRASGSITFVINIGDTYVPTKGCPIYIHEIKGVTDTVAFAGVIGPIDRKWQGNDGLTKYTLTLLPFETCLDQIRIAPISYTATDASTIVSALFPAGVPFTLTAPAASGVLVDRLYNFDTISDAFTSLALEVGWVWQIDMATQSLYFGPQLTPASPFTVNNSNPMLWETLDYKLDPSDYRNRQTIQIAQTAFVPSYEYFNAGGLSSFTLSKRAAKVNRGILINEASDQRPDAFLVFSGNPSQGDTFSLGQSSFDSLAASPTGTQTYTTSITTTFAMPGTANAAIIECWGAGGAGGSNVGLKGGGGGGGGGYTKKMVIATGNLTITLPAAPAGGAGSGPSASDTTVFSGATELCRGHGGVGGTAGGAGGAGGAGDHAGGTGGRCTTATGGGGGGGGAGTSSLAGTNGADNSTTSGGAGGSFGGGLGGDLNITPAFADGAAPGGGGAAAGGKTSGNYNGGNGGIGKIVITYGTITFHDFNFTNALDNEALRGVLIGANATATAANAAAAINADRAIQAGFSLPTWEDEVFNALATGASLQAFCKIQSGDWDSTVPLNNNVPVLNSAGSPAAWTTAVTAGGVDTSGDTILTCGIDTTTDLTYTVGSTTVTSNIGPLAASHALLIEYYKMGSDSISVEDTSAVTSLASTEHGTGEYQQFLQDTGATDPTAAWALAVSILDALKLARIYLSFEIDRAGLVPGQVLTVAVSGPGSGTTGAPFTLNGAWRIQQVDATLVPGLETLGEPFGHFRYTVQAYNAPSGTLFIDANPARSLLDTLAGGATGLSALRINTLGT
jgi:hypothetical protein